jgi:carbon monoxide dehydrogenase subunit G
MRISGRYPFAAPRDRVWDLLMDTTAIAGCVPGCKELRDLGDDRYQAELVVAVAAITGKYDATIAIENRNAPHSYRLAVKGSGRPGFVQGHADITLEDSDGQTMVAVDGTADVGGAVARVGQRLLEGVARMMMDRFFACLQTKLKASGPKPEA